MTNFKIVPLTELKKAIEEITEKGWRLTKTSYDSNVVDFNGDRVDLRVERKAAIWWDEPYQPKHLAEPTPKKFYHKIEVVSSEDEELETEETESGEVASEEEK